MQNKNKMSWHEDTSFVLAVLIAGVIVAVVLISVVYWTQNFVTEFDSEGNQLIKNGLQEQINDLNQQVDDISARLDELEK